MNNVYQELLKRAGLAKPGSDIKRDHPALYRAAKRAVMVVGGTWAERVRLLYEMENGGEQMSDKTITVPADAKSVTLNIERPGELAGMTLRQALLAVPGDRHAVVRVLERSAINGNRLCWDMLLPAIPSPAEEMSKRIAKIERFSECQMCDVAVLLDERPVKTMGMQDQPRGGMAFVFEVENDA